MKTVVLCGGSGTRLGLPDIPKPMVPIDGVPLLERTVRAAVGYRFDDFLFMSGHLAESIQSYFGDGEAFGAAIRHVVESEPLGTAGCFNQIRDVLNEPFLVIYGDTLMDVDLDAFVRFASSRGGAGTIFAHPNDHPFDSDLLEVDAEGCILAFHAKPRPQGAHYPNLVSAGLYVLSPAALEVVPASGASDWGRDIFPSLAQAMNLHAYRSVEYIKDIGTPERLASAIRHLRQGRVERLSLRHRKAAVFLDRDGVIVEERDGLYSPREVALVPGAAGAIKRFNEAGIPVICVTNQPGIAKGFMDWSDLRAVTGEIDHALANEAGAYLDDVFICPHHPEVGWPGEVPELKIECECRKPREGLLTLAAKAHNLDLARSFLVGDRYCDIAAGRAAGVKSILVRTGHGGSDESSYAISPDMVCADIVEAADAILRGAE